MAVAGDGGPRRPLPKCASLAIGSLPHTSVTAAVDLMIEFNPVCPAWPQLPRLDFREDMYVQFSECMPGVVLDLARRRLWFDMDRTPIEMAGFYERYLAQETGLCHISADYARGLEPFLERLPTPEALFVKGQVTGPSTFGLSVKDGENRPVLYQEHLFDAVVKALQLKGSWQAERFLAAAPDLTPVIFFDEPYLTQAGSAMISLPPEQISASLSECFAPVAAKGGYAGTHVCGATDWGLLAETDVDILHFDAADHAQEFFLYKNEIAAFLERGGLLAWGMIPTDERSLDLSGGEVADRVMAAAERVAGFAPTGIDAEAVLKHSFVSQSCGLGSRSTAVAERCLALATETASLLAAQLGSGT